MPQDTFDVLRDLVRTAQCKPGWAFRIVDEDGALRLVITVPGADSYVPANPLTVSHYLPVPTTTYNRASWARWMFEMCRRVENHELGEWFRVAVPCLECDKGVVPGAAPYDSCEACLRTGYTLHRPYAPLHGPGEDPYTVHEYRPSEDARVLQDGTRSDFKF